MLMASKRASLLLSGILVTLVTNTVSAAGSTPEGFWMLENTDTDMPFGGLKLNTSHHFELLIYDNKCLPYTVEGDIKQKTVNNWELKSNIDYSNTFSLTRDGKKLKLVDTENQSMFFFETTENNLKKAIKQNCKKTNATLNKKVNE